MYYNTGLRQRKRPFFSHPTPRFRGFRIVFENILFVAYYYMVTKEHAKSIDVIVIDSVIRGLFTINNES